MTRSELKKQAKEALRGRWGTVIAIILIYQVIIYALSYLSQKILFVSIGSIAITVPMVFGLAGQMLKFSRKEEVGVLDFFKIGFNNYSKGWSIYFRVFLKMLAPIIIYVLAIAMIIVAITSMVSDNISMDTGAIIGCIGIVLLIVSLIWLIIKSFSYALVQYIGNDNLELSGKEIVEKSADIMKGHKFEYFMLNLSFIGWGILCGVTFGIGMLWLIPYMEITKAKFYEYVAGINKTIE